VKPAPQPPTKSVDGDGRPVPTWSAEAPLAVTALQWADVEGRLWCLEHNDVCRELSVYKCTEGDFEIRVEVRVPDETPAAAMQFEALRVAGAAVHASFYKTGGVPKWLHLVEVLVRGSQQVIISRVSLEGHKGELLLLHEVASHVAWVTGDRRARPASATTPVSAPWRDRP
jgi:hypothetical protein